jgi:predicted enzyme related to lactoylglutathione lyase
MALATDPQGLQFGLWQGASGPARHLRLPGAPNWVELSSPDAFEAALFYGAVLDWDQQESEHLDVWWEHERVVVRVQGYNVAALRTQDTSGPATGWHVSFEVADVELAGAEALRLGGEVVSPPTGTPYGPTALLRDPGGAHFTVIAPSGSGAGHMNPRFAGAAGHGTTVLTGRGPGS